MENFNITLSSTAQGEAVETVKDLSINIIVNDGAISVNGKREIVKLDNSKVEIALPYDAYNIRVVEAENQIAGTLLSSDQKAALQSKVDIWKAFKIHVLAGLEVAMKAQYELDNPITV